jgi:hypothetical protein
MNENHIIIGEQIFWPNTCRKSYVLPKPRLCENIYERAAPKKIRSHIK